MIRTHLRSNVVGYLALFVAMSGTAVALPATNTVFSDDIVNGQVTTRDISDTNGVRSADVRDDDKNGGGLAAIDLASNSVGSSEIATDGVGGEEIATDGVGASEIATDGVGGEEIAPDVVGASEIAPQSVTSSEIGADAVTATEIADGAVGGPQLADVIEVATSFEVSVEDATAGDGDYGLGSIFVDCDTASRTLLGASIEWTDTNNQNEAMLRQIEMVRDQPGLGLDGAIVTGVFDGGGGDANPGKFIAHATCLDRSQPD
jgi:hypothetical protein